MVGKYRLLSQIPVQKHGRWYWEDDNDFSIARHVRRVVPRTAGPKPCAPMCRRCFRHLRPKPPLWEMQLISGPDESAGGHVLSRFHHGVGDGDPPGPDDHRDLGDTAGDATPGMSAATSTTTHSRCPACRRALGDGRHRLCPTRRRGRPSHAGDAISAAGRLLRYDQPTRPQGTLTTAVDTARHPVRLLDALTSVSSVDNEFSNLLARDRAAPARRAGRRGRLGGHPWRPEKSVAWVESIPWTVCDPGRALVERSTTSSLAAVALALTDYLTERASRTFVISPG